MKRNGFELESAEREEGGEVLIGVGVDAPVRCLKACRAETRQGKLQQDTESIPEALVWVDELARSLSCPPNPHWECCAELNILMLRNFHTLPGAALLAYHSYTRQSKADLWNNMTAAWCLDPNTAAQAAQGAGPAPAHVLMLGLLLSRAFAPYPEAGAVKYTFHKPDWLFGWCSKWQHPGKELHVIELQAYSQACRAPVRTVFIPLF